MTTTTVPPLQDFRVTGFSQNWYQAAPDVPRQPGGTCWHCGAGIANEVHAENTVTGEHITVGTTCAERIGLDPEGLKAMLADKYAEERAMRSAAGRAAAQAAWAAQDAVEEAQYGPHGTAGRYLDGGCRCDTCLAAAPCGTLHGWTVRDCRCLDCQDALVAANPAWREGSDGGRGYRFRTMDVLVDVDTGEIIADARKVETRYGYRWRSDSRNVWLPVRPVRRSTLASKGYVEAEAPFIVDTIRTRQGWWDKPVLRVGEPVFDNWGEAVTRR